MGARSSAPAPIPSARGSIPKIIASVVIRMGRSLVLPAVITASARSIPRVCNTFA